MTGSDDVRALWLEHVARTRSWNEDRTDADRDQLIDLVVEQLRRRPGLAPQLRDAVHETDDADYADFLLAVLVPEREVAIEDPDEFRAHPEVAFNAEKMPIRLAAALVRMTTFPPAKDEAGLVGYTATWFAGRPLASVGETWPRSTNGTPLAHVVQVDLGDDRYEKVPDSLGLPPRGLLQIFHDLHTYGDLDDGGSKAWRVRLLDVAATSSLTPLPWPIDLDASAMIGAVPARVSPMATVPSFLDVDLADADAEERYERVATWLEQYPYDRNEFMAPDRAGGESPWDKDSSPPDPVSRLCGFGYNEFNPDYQEMLDVQLPLVAGDEHVMLADINPLQFTDEDWFHGGRHLQVWIRRSDLDARNFGACWAMIRTDG